MLQVQPKDKYILGSSHHGSVVINPTSSGCKFNTLPLFRRLSIAVSCGVGQSPGSHLALEWLWCTPAPVALIQLPAWEPPYAASAALKNKKQTNKKNLLSSICILVFPFYCVSGKSGDYVNEGVTFRFVWH